MTRLARLFVLVVGLLPFEPALSGASAFGQAGRSENQKKFDEGMRSAERLATIGYVGAVAGIVLLVLSIPLMVYLDRKKKARKKALQPQSEPSEDAEEPPRPSRP